MEKRKNVIDVWKEVFSRPNYIILAVMLALIFYFATALMAHFRLLTFENFFSYIISFHKTVLISSLLSTIIISLLFGILFSLILYKTRMIKTSSGKVGIFATLGIFLGILAPGCAACGIGIISALGFGAVAISLLPFKGLELSVLSILFLIVAIVEISKNINRGMVCKINTQKMKGGKKW